MTGPHMANIQFVSITCGAKIQGHIFEPVRKKKAEDYNCKV